MKTIAQQTENARGRPMVVDNEPVQRTIIGTPVSLFDAESVSIDDARDDPIAPGSDLYSAAIFHSVSE